MPMPFYLGTLVFIAMWIYCWLCCFFFCFISIVKNYPIQRVTWHREGKNARRSVLTAYRRDFFPVARSIRMRVTFVADDTKNILLVRWEFSVSLFLMLRFSFFLDFDDFLLVFSSLKVPPYIIFVIDVTHTTTTTVKITFTVAMIFCRYRLSEGTISAASGTQTIQNIKFIHLELDVHII